MQYLYVLLFTGLPFLIAGLLGLVLPLLTLASYRNFGAGLALIGFGFLVDAWTMGQPYLRVGVTLYPLDLPMVIVAAAAGLRWLLRDDLPRRHPAWVLLALLFFAGLALGLARHGTAAGVQARGDFYAIAAASYAMSFPISTQQLRRVVGLFNALGAALLLLCLYRWTVYYGDIRDLLPPGGSYNVDGPTRVIGSSFALILAELAVLGLFFGAAGLGGGAARWLGPVLVAAVLALQHRSVWLASAAGVLMSLLVARAQRAPLWQQLLVGMAVVTVAVFPLVFSQTLTSEIGSSAARAAAGQGTVQARLENWQSTVQKWAGEGARTIALGRLPGSDTERTVTGADGQQRRIYFGAHNHYIGVLTGQGVVGLAAFLWIVGHAFRGLWRLVQRGDDAAPGAALLLVMLCMQLVYYVAYGVDLMQYLWIGLAVAWVAGHRSDVASRGWADTLLAPPRTAAS